VETCRADLGPSLQKRRGAKTQPARPSHTRTSVVSATSGNYGTDRLVHVFWTRKVVWILDLREWSRSTHEQLGPAEEGGVKVRAPPILPSLPPHLTPGPFILPTVRGILPLKMARSSSGRSLTAAWRFVLSHSITPFAFRGLMVAVC